MSRPTWRKRQAEGVNWKDLNPWEALIVRQRLIIREHGDSSDHLSDAEVFSSYLVSVASSVSGYETRKDAKGNKRMVSKVQRSPSIEAHYVDVWSEWHRATGLEVPYWLEQMRPILESQKGD